MELFGLRGGTPSSFLSLGDGLPRLAGSDIGRLLEQAGSSRAAVLDRASPATIPAQRPGALLPYPPRAPAFSGLAQFDVHHLAEGTFTEATIRNMHRAVLQAKTDSAWRRMMEDIRQHGRRMGSIGWKDYLGEIRWMDRWYRGPHFIDYVRDPHQVELVKAPILTYEAGQGDCDDSSTLLCASMGTLGAPHRFRTYRADPRRPREWSHVVGQVWVPGEGWVNDDLTIRGAFPGFEPQGYETKDWPEPKW